MSRFILLVSAKDLELGGMDTPVQLKSSKRQIAFEGQIISLWLHHIIRHPDYLSFVAIKFLARKVFMEDTEGYCLDSDISSRVLVGLLDVRVYKANTRVIMWGLFHKDMLVGLDRALVAARLGKGIPRLHDLHLLDDPKDLVNYFPLLLDVSGMALVEHRRLAIAGVEYFKKKFHLVPIADSAWKREFHFFPAKCLVIGVWVGLFCWSMGIKALRFMIFVWKIFVNGFCNFWVGYVYGQFDGKWWLRPLGM